MAILGADLSHFQGRPDFVAVAASGRRFVILKATEGSTYVDPMFAADRAAAHKAGLIVGIYHFARGGPVAAEAAFFLRTVGPLAVGEFLVLDDEVPAVTPAWVQSWCRAVAAATTVRALVYANQTTENTGNWSSVVADGDQLWLARYDGALTQPTGGPWGAPVMKQYSDRGVVAGIAGPVDLDVFYGTDAQLLALGLRGAHPDSTPTVQEDAMRLIRTPDGTIWTVTDTQVLPAASLDAANSLCKIYGIQWLDVSFADKDAAYLDAQARLSNWLLGVQNYVLGAQPTTDQKPWLFDRIVGIGTAVAALGQPTVDAAAVAAALAADTAFTQSLAAAAVAALDADIAKRFGAATGS